MKKTYFKSIFILLTVCLAAAVIFFIFNNQKANQVNADAENNHIPVITSVSYSTSSTDVNFESTASDSDPGDTLKLYICKDSSCTDCGPNSGEETLRPDGYGSYTNLYSSDSENFSAVNEAEPDEDSTYVYTDGTKAQDTYRLENHTAGTGTVSYVEVYARMRYDSSGDSGRIAIFTHGNLYYGNSEALTDSYQNYSKRWNANPSTSLLWTWEEVDALEAGVQLSLNASDTTYCTQVYVKVGYIGGNNTASNCWAFSGSGAATNPSASLHCSETANNDYWAKVCDNNDSCSSIIPDSEVKNFIATSTPSCGGIGVADVDSKTSWDEAHDAATNTVQSSAPYFIVDSSKRWFYVSEGDYWDYNFTVSRGFLYFDTSAIGSSSTILSATTSLHGYSVGGSSFVAGTMVYTPGGFIPIEQIKVGDLVFSVNTETWESKPKRVLSIIRGETQSIVKIQTVNESFESTPLHPYWVIGEGWVEARKLQIGDYVKTFNGGSFKIISFKMMEKREEVWNLRVAENYNYFVGYGMLLVHNDGVFWALHVAKGVQHDPLISGDFGSHLDKTDSGGSISGMLWNISTYNNIALNATGTNWINKNGTTAFCLRLSDDINDTASQVYVPIAIECGAGAVNWPELTVTYSKNTPFTCSASEGGNNNGGLAFAPPFFSPPAVSTSSIIINNGGSCASSTNVNLSLSAEGATEMAISNSSDFENTIWENYKGLKDWTLIPGDGGKTIFAKFKNSVGTVFKTASSSIILNAEQMPDVASFKAIPVNHTILLSWSNPLVSDFRGVKIARSISGFPSLSDEIIYDGTGESFENTSPKEGIEYYYTAFAYDYCLDYSLGAKASTTLFLEKPIPIDHSTTSFPSSSESYSPEEQPPNISSGTPALPPSSTNNISQSSEGRSKNILQAVYGIIDGLEENSALKRITDKVFTPAAISLAVANLTGVSSVSFPGLFRNFSFNIIQVWAVLTGLFRKKRKPWGFVFSSFNKKPLNGAVVGIYNAAGNKLRENQVTDEFGRFGFLVDSGEYYIKVSKPGYVFPASKNDFTSMENIYRGEVISIKKGEAGFIKVNIPLDPDVFIASSKKISLRRFFNGFQSFFERASLAIFIPGFVFSVSAYTITPSLYNKLIVGTYLFLAVSIMAFSIRLKKQYGVFSDLQSGKPLEGVNIGLFEEKYGHLAQERMTDRKGRYSFLVSPGVYYIIGEKEDYHSFQSDLLVVESKEGAIQKDFKMEKK